MTQVKQDAIKALYSQCSRQLTPVMLQALLRIISRG